MDDFLTELGFVINNEEGFFEKRNEKPDKFLFEFETNNSKFTETVADENRDSRNMLLT